MDKKAALKNDKEGLRSKRKKAKLMDLLALTKGKTPPKEIDFGRPEGRELL